MTRIVLRQSLLLLALALIPAIGAAVYHRDRIPWRAPAVAEGEVTIDQIRAWGADVFWIDARPQTEFEREHVPGAVSLNLDQWNQSLPQVLMKWSPQMRVVVYCSSQSCAASHEVAERLRSEAQLQNVYVLHGGWEAWKEAQR